MMYFDPNCKWLLRLLHLDDSVLDLTQDYAEKKTKSKARLAKERMMTFIQFDILLPNRFRCWRRNKRSREIM